MKQTFSLGRINHSLQEFAHEDLENLDKRLLKGFYVNNKWELENDAFLKKARFADRTKLNFKHAANIVRVNDLRKGREIVHALKKNISQIVPTKVNQVDA
jgi:hypothetical protein